MVVSSLRRLGSVGELVLPLPADPMLLPPEEWCPLGLLPLIPEPEEPVLPLPEEPVVPRSLEEPIVPLPDEPPVLPEPLLLPLEPP